MRYQPYNRLELLILSIFSRDTDISVINFGTIYDQENSFIAEIESIYYDCLLNDFVSLGGQSPESVEMTEKVLSVIETKKLPKKYNFINLGTKEEKPVEKKKEIVKKPEPVKEVDEFEEDDYFEEVIEAPKEFTATVNDVGYLELLGIKKERLALL